MAKSTPKPAFILHLQRQIDNNCTKVENTFMDLSPEVLNWKLNSEEWSILQCFEHLTLSRGLFRPGLLKAIKNAPTAPLANDVYIPTFIGAWYYKELINPTINVKTLAPYRPDQSSNLPLDTIDKYLDGLAEVESWVEQAVLIDLNRSRAKLYFVMKLNVGDILRSIIAHDTLHINQAARALELQTTL